MNVLKKILKGIWKFFRPPRKISFTKEGLIFTILSFPIGLAAINTGNNMLYLVLGMVLSIIAISGLLSESSLKKIIIYAKVPRWTIAGMDFSTLATVENTNRFIPSYLIRISHLWAEKNSSNQNGFLIKVDCQKKEMARIKSQFSERGVYHLMGYRIATRFPFGLFDKSRDISQPMNITAYPKPIFYPDDFFGIGLHQGEKETNIRGSGWDLYSLREYTSGDDSRFIHWKISAKVGRPILREFSIPGQKKLIIFFNNKILNSVPKTIFEKAVSHTAYLALIGLKEGREVGFYSPEISFPPEKGQSQYHRIMNYLAKVKSELLDNPADGKNPLENIFKNLKGMDEYSFIKIDPNQSKVST